MYWIDGSCKTIMGHHCNLCCLCPGKISIYCNTSYSCISRKCVSIHGLRSRYNCHCISRIFLFLIQNSGNYSTGKRADNISKAVYCNNSTYNKVSNFSAGCSQTTFHYRTQTIYFSYRRPRTCALISLISINIFCIFTGLISHLFIRSYIIPSYKKIKQNSSRNNRDNSNTNIETKTFFFQILHHPGSTIQTIGTSTTQIYGLGFGNKIYRIKSRYLPCSRPAAPYINSCYCTFLTDNYSTSGSGFCILGMPNFYTRYIGN